MLASVYLLTASLFDIYIIITSTCIKDSITIDHIGELNGGASIFITHYDIGSEYKCGNKTTPLSCPAYTKQCNNCKKYNHYASACRSSETLEAINQLLWNYSDNEREQVHSIINNESDCKHLANIHINIGNKVLTIEFQHDSATSCHTLTKTDYNRLRKPNLSSTNTIMTFYDQTKRPSLGCTADGRRAK